MAPAAARASTFTVNTASDVTNGAAACTDANPGTLCSIRDALDAADNDGVADRVEIPAGTYTLSIGQLTAAGPDGLEIVGPGPDQAAISGADQFRVLEIDHAAATVEGLTIRNGETLNAGSGGGILVDDAASFTLRDSVLRDNYVNDVGTSEGGGIAVIEDEPAGTTTAAIEDSVIRDNVAGEAAGSQGGDGGGIFAFEGGGGNGEMTVTRSTIADNAALAGQDTFAEGGGIDANFELQVVASTISGNSAHSQTVPTEFGFGLGGGVHLGSQGDNTLVNTTISGNTASAAGNAINAEAFGGGLHAAQVNTVTLTNVTLADNTATAPGDQAGGNLELDSADVTLLNTSLSAGAPDDCSAAPASASNSLDGGTSCGLGSVNGNLSGVDPKLGPLADNGGPADTHALLAGSPALDAGAGCPATDERGVSRPQGAACDIGAYEARKGGEVGGIAGRAIVRRGRAAISFDCVGDDAAVCGGRIVILARVGAGAARVAAGKRRRIGSVLYSVPVGADRVVKVRLTRRGRRVLRSRPNGRLRALVQITQTTPAGPGASRKVTLVRRKNR